jgi:predicted permease
LSRAPLFSATVVLTLTIGIGAAAAIFAVVDAVLLRPLPFGHPSQIVGASFDMPAINLNHAQLTSGTYYTFQKYAQSIDGIALYQDGSVSIQDPDGRGDPERMTIIQTTANLFGVLQVSPLLGRTYDAAEDAPKGPRVVVISEGVWRTRYAADVHVIGKKVMINGRETEIIGVMPASFRFPSASARIWMPLQLDPVAAFAGGFNYNSVARLKPGISVDAAERDFANVLPRVTDVAPMLAPGITMKMVLDQAHPKPRIIPLRDEVVGDISHTLWMVAATAGLVLLVTCANVTNLLLVRADGRHRELSVRAALGAGQRRVILHFFTESAILAAMSAVLGLGVAAVAIKMLVDAGPTEIPRLAEVHVGLSVVLFTFIAATLIAIACSALPAIRFTRGNPLGGLRDGGRGGTVGSSRQRARGILVAAQMAFALVVLSASGLLLRSFQRLHAVRPGFNPDGVASLWVSLPSARYTTDSSRMRFFARLTERAAHIPGVQSVGVTSRVPLEPNGMNANPFYVEGDASSTTKIPPLEVYISCDSGYFKTMGIPLLAGRNFDILERQRGDEAIISQETAWQFFHDSTGRAALGRRFRPLPSGQWGTVIGVVGSVHDTSLATGPTRAVYQPESISADTIFGGPKSTMAVVMRTNGDIANATHSLQALIREMDPTLPTFDGSSMRATMSASIARLTFTIIVLGVAAGVTLVLGVIGLYGVIAYVVTLRTREIGVRIALGAQPRSVAALVTKHGLTLSVSGIVVGLVLVAIVARFLRSMLFEIAPTDPVTLGAASAILLAFALLASWIPARRAARVNPMEALRSD